VLWSIGSSARLAGTPGDRRAGLRFALHQAPAASVLTIDCSFLGPSPETVETAVNCRRERCRIVAAAARDVDRTSPT
jgi:hypothetical protein